MTSRPRSARSRSLQLEGLESRWLLAADLRITEFMASNDRTLDDGDGNSSDWVELHNTGTDPLDLAGWHLTDDPDVRDKWTFPSQTLGPDEYLLVFASGQDGENYTDFDGHPHTSFKLAREGEYLALTDPNLVVAQEFSTAYPKQFVDISYGIGQQRSSLVAPTGPATYLVPDDGALGTSWTGIGFDDASWHTAIPGAAGLGYRTRGGSTGLAQPFDDDTAALPSGAFPAEYPNWMHTTDGRGSAQVDAGVLHLHHGGSGSEHMLAVTTDVPDGAFVVSGRVGRAGGGNTGSNNVGMVIGNATVVFHPGYASTPGAFRYGRLDDSTITGNQSMGFVPAEGALHHMQIAVTPNGSSWDLAVTVTDAGNSDNVFTDQVTIRASDIGETIHQVGFVRNGGAGGDGIFDDLVITREVPDDDVDAAQIGTDVAASMFDTSASMYVRYPFSMNGEGDVEQLTLRMRYDDGFIAYLNGVPVASRNAPARPSFDSTAIGKRESEAANQWEDIDISSHATALRSGQNVLAIHGMNLAATDADFLISAELVAESAPRDGLYFQQPTPGAPNSFGWLGVTESEVLFSREGGAFTEPFSVTLTADRPGGAIFYTTDGTLPTENSPRYVEPIPVDSTTHVRARVIQPDFVPGPVRTEAYLHLGADVAGFTSQLPIMVIDNLGAGAIPNKGWNSTGAGIRAVPRQPAHLLLFEPEHGPSALAPKASLDSRIGIRVRGAFSSSWPEPGYSVETWHDGIDDDADITPLGMSAASNWALYAPNLTQDRSLIQNTLLFELSNQMGHWATDFRYVEAFINRDGGDVTMSDFVGLYVIEERVEREPGRLEFEPFAADASSGGWLLEINRLDAISLDGETPKNFHTAGPNGVLQTPRDLTRGSSRGDDIPRQQNAYINFDDPGGYEINSVQRQAIEDWFQTMEDVLYDRTDVAWNDPVDGYAKYIDVDSFVDYFILQNLPKTGDGLLISMWLYNPDPNQGGKLTFGPIWDNDYDTYTGNPASDLLHRADRLWYDRLFDDPDFMQKYTDRWQSLRDTVLSTANIESVMEDLFARIGDQAAINDGVPDWAARQEFIRTWVIDRAAAIDRTFVARPEFGTSETVVPAGFSLAISASQGTIYFTNDGSDPRLPGGDVADNAIEYRQPITMTENTPIRARVLDNGRWSGVIGSEFLIASPMPLRISEINYHPQDATPGEPNAPSEQFEFIELVNTGPLPMDVGGVQLVESDVDGHTEGVGFVFASQILEANQRVVVVRDRQAFQSRYGDSVDIADGAGNGNVIGVFSGDLDDRGEQLTLLDPTGNAIQQFRYVGGKPWPDRPAGRGSTLEVVDTEGSYNDPGNWKSSSQYSGSPGDIDRGLEGQIVINELLSSPPVGQDDLIELRNTTGHDIDITGWYVSNSSRDYYRVRIANETTVPAGGYQLLNATELGIPLDGARGGEVLVTAAGADGTPTSFVDHIRFGVSDIGTSVGPWPSEEEPFVQLETATLGAPNSGPKVGEITISEVHYAPLDVDGPGPVRDRDFAFVELYNRTDRPIDVGGWQLSGGIEFTFDAGTVVNANDVLTVVRFNPSSGITPTTFRFLYGMALDAPLVGGHRDTLDRENGQVQLTRPGSPSADAPNFTPTILVDEVAYHSTSPWPESAGGSGDSLHRTRPGDRGDLATSWRAAPPDPGTAQFVTRRAGDSNADGQFDQLDIVMVLQAGKYKQAQHATFEEGDWNEDGFFDQRDIVVALQAGTFLQGPANALAQRPSERSASVAEGIAKRPSDPVRSAAIDAIFGEVFP